MVKFVISKLNRPILKFFGSIVASGCMYGRTGVPAGGPGVVEAGDVGVERTLHSRVVEVRVHVIIRARIKVVHLQQHHLYIYIYSYSSMPHYYYLISDHEIDGVLTYVRRTEGVIGGETRSSDWQLGA